MSGEWLALGAVAALAAAGVARGSMAKSGVYEVEMEWSDEGGLYGELAQRDGRSLDGGDLWNALGDSQSAWEEFVKELLKNEGWKRNPTMGSLPSEDTVFPDGSTMAQGDSSYWEVVVHESCISPGLMGDIYTYKLTVRIPPKARYFPPGTGRTLSWNPGGGQIG